MSLENFFQRAEEISDILLNLTKDVARHTKLFQKAARVGALNDLSARLRAAEDAVDKLRHGLTDASNHLKADGKRAWNSDSYSEELCTTAKKSHVKIHRQDDYLYCYPALIRVLPEEPAVVINRAKEKRVRPSVLLLRLKKLQEMPTRFRPQAFLKSIEAAYKVVGARKGSKGGVVKLADIYNVLTLLPGQKSEYSRHEFARDLYLLDCHLAEAVDGRRVQLHPARGGERTNQILVTVSKEADLLRYYGISFKRSPGS
jgi:hypothetical protein